MTLTFVLFLLLIFAASILGGLLPLLVRLTHRRMQIALSFVSGIMVGVSMFDMLPGALEVGMHAGGEAHAALLPVIWWMVGGFLCIFLLERFICFHHHGVPGEACEHEHVHASSWIGGLVGLSIHGLISGVALGAVSASAVEGDAAGGIAAMGILLAIVFHKPFDALALGTLLAADGRSRSMRHWMNLAYAFVTPVGALIGLAGFDGGDGMAISAALAFAVGMFLCIALSDLLPELQFHAHDRVALTLALLLGLAVGFGSSLVGEHGHGEGHEEEPHTMIIWPLPADST